MSDTDAVADAALEINIPEIQAEVTAMFHEYETALVSNDVETLDRLFFNAPTTIRYGGGENLYGYEEIAAFRSGRPNVDLARTLERVEITTYGRDFATASTHYIKPSAPTKVGRQMQTWVRTLEGWKVVAAHVSMIERPEGS